VADHECSAAGKRQETILAPALRYAVHNLCAPPPHHNLAPPTPHTRTNPCHRSAALPPFFSARPFTLPATAASISPARPPSVRDPKYICATADLAWLEHCLQSSIPPAPADHVGSANCPLSQWHTCEKSARTKLH